MQKIATLKLEVHSPAGGKDYIYPDCKISQCLADLLNQTCLSPRALKVLSVVFDFEYKGKKHPALVELGAKFVN
jgi:hypothetical protein